MRIYIILNIYERVRELCNIILLLSYVLISADHEQSNENYFISSQYHTIIIHSSPPKTCSNMILTNMTFKKYQQ